MKNYLIVSIDTDEAGVELNRATNFYVDEFDVEEMISATQGIIVQQFPHLLESSSGFFTVDIETGLPLLRTYINMTDVSESIANTIENDGESVDYEAIYTDEPIYSDVQLFADLVDVDIEMLLGKLEGYYMGLYEIDEKWEICEDEPQVGDEVVFITEDDSHIECGSIGIVTDEELDTFKVNFNNGQKCWVLMKDEVAKIIKK